MGIVRSRRRSRRPDHAPKPVREPRRAVEALEGRVLFDAFTWDGGGADANWSTAANWVDDVAPSGAGDSLTFPISADRKANTNDLPTESPISPGTVRTLISSVTFEGGGYTIGGNAIGLGIGGVTDTSTAGGGNALNLPIVLVVDGGARVHDADDAAALTLGGVISGRGGISRSGAGVVIITGANTYSGPTFLNTGNTYANNPSGSAFGTPTGGAHVINTGGTLRGNGGFTGPLANNATLAPGAASGQPGALETGSIDFGGSAEFLLNVTDATPGTGHDQLVVTGTVDLGTGFPLIESNSTFLPAGGETLFVIVNDGIDPIVGNFASLEQGGTVDINGFFYEISYAGDSETNALTGGNDFALRAVAPNETPVNTVPAAQATDEDAALVFSAAGDNAITIADADGGSLAVTLSVPAGRGTLTLPSDDLVTAGANGSRSVTIAGPVADLNAALDGLSFAPAADSTAGLALTVSTTDGALTDSDDVAITVNALNDAPVNAVPPTQVVARDGTVVFGLSNSNRIAVADVDAGGDDVAVRLTWTNGTFTFGSTGGVVLSDEAQGGGSSTATITGPVSAVNAALNDSTFSPTPGFSGTADIEVRTSDLAHNGAGGAMTDTDTFTVAVSPPGGLDFVPATYTVVEGGAAVTLTVNRTGGASGPATVDYAVTGGTAAAGADFTAATGTLAFAEGETSKTITATVADDALDEDDETLNVTLSNPTGAGVLGVVATTAVVTITDDDPSPALSVNDAAATEGGAATFTVTLSTPSGRPVTVGFATAGGTATSGGDFTAAAGTLTFAPGETSKAFAVATLADADQEPAETFAVTLANPVNATLADAAGEGTIDNVPNAPPVAAADVAALAPGQASAVVAVLANDTDADGDALAVGTVSAPAHGTAVRNADNTVTYTPALGYAGTDSFTYSVIDARGGAAEGTVNLTVAGNGVVVNPADPRKQDLFVAATPGDDVVQLVRVGRQVRVLVGGQDQGTFAATGNIVISGGAGNDALAIGRLKNPVIFNGGDGDDTLTGGARNDVLVGGPGNDVFNGGGGRDLVIGGDGADAISGLGGNDLLIAGATAYDADTADNRRALADLLAALAGRSRYAAKLAALTAPAGVGPTGARLAPGTTVFDDGDVDTLAGGASQDLLAADTDGTAVDLLTKRARNESVIEL